MGNIKDLDGNDLYKSFHTGNGNDRLRILLKKGDNDFIDALGYRWAYRCRSKFRPCKLTPLEMLARMGCS